MNNVTIGFGRNIGAKCRSAPSDKLTDWEWGEFRHQIAELATSCGGSVHFTGVGIGTWEGEEEEAGCIAFFADERFDHLAFRANVHILCVRYRQDAIAVTAAESELYY